MDDGGGGAEGGESNRWEKRAELEVVIRGNLAAQAYIKMACTIMVYLAFTWSTVVLLGGYVGSLQRKDFWSLTIITIIEATSIFNELESQDKVKIGIWNITGGILINVVDSLNRWRLRASYLRLWEGALSQKFVAILAPAVRLMFNLLLLFNLYGPVASVGLSSWRLLQRDYHGKGVDNGSGEVNLMRGLDFFYTLVLCHGVLYLLLLLLVLSQIDLAVSFTQHCKLPNTRIISAYMKDTLDRCGQDPSVLAAEETSFLNYLVRLLESESLENYLSGARALCVLINDGEDASSIILRSRSKVQRLLDMLGQRSGEKVAETRLLSAKIVADLARGMQLSQFPGAIRCVLSLVETTPRQHALWMTKNKNNRQLILQGLRTVEGLACDAHNCREICAAPGLLAKITAPLYSATLIHDMSKSAAWADVARASLRAVRQLIHVAPGRAGRRLRREISSNARAVANLESILHLPAAGSGQQLQISAMEILTELTMDPSVNIRKETRENLVRKQVSIFLAEGGQDEVPTASPIKKETKKQGAIKEKKKDIKAAAGETLSILSKSELISRFIVTEHNDIVDRLTAGMIDAKCINIRYRTWSAEILGNICTHCKELANEALLQEVIKTLTKPITEASGRTISAPGDNEEIRENSSHGDDVEKQSRPKNTGEGKKGHGIKPIKASDQQEDEDEADMKELQQALLSLTLVIHGTVPLLQESAARDAFVDKLKAIVDDNCQERTPVSLRIVKLCCQIVISHNRCTTSEQKKEFLESLSKASKNMANLESCMLFAGTDCEMEKIARPLLSDLEEELSWLPSY